MSYVIGITGGVGAGKSRVLSLLSEQFGAEVILADEVGRELMEPDGACFPAVVELFGPQVLKADGTLDRRKIAEIIFQDKTMLERQNAIIHPAVKAEIVRRCERCQAEWIAVEAALLLEARYEDICGEVWYIYADEETRRKRLRESRGYSDERIDAVMSNQLSEAKFRAGCQRVIDNSGSIGWTKEQIERALNELKDKGN
ncbi:MAG: dephospho-CoA kinase [Lachnospiraceae bacterium]|nr:dephospho-CoA kinase [Lachnospiraceae bacterium]